MSHRASTKLNTLPTCPYPKLWMLRLFDTSVLRKQKINRPSMHHRENSFADHLNLNTPFPLHPHHTNIHTQKKQKKKVGYQFFVEKKIAWPHQPFTKGMSSDVMYLGSDFPLPPLLKKVSVCDVLFFPPSLYSPTCPLDPEPTAGGTSHPNYNNLPPLITIS